ncbi:cytochrome b N-terminal domain-containing protein [Ferrimicrobium sp.]|uniref:cytochrome b N-terminal domain-containing protein n=1 Tax=Ferrimicrobium sp. TaxID=2926050 RepID=UPI0026293BB0|nr:cytochrome b N-terminal domain-containing protein [Ferrimicrobium sp.]
MNGHPVIGAIVNLNHPDHYIHWGFILISMANFIVIVILVVLFALAISLPFLKGKPVKRKKYQPAAAASGDDESEGWTAHGRRLGLKYLPPDKLLPDGQPSYVASWVYVFGVLTIGALIMAILSGMVLAIEGPTWWHLSDIGHFVNSLHLWSVELFMGFMTVHLWAKFWMAAWRGKRWLTWMTGMLAFLVSIVEAFTGYLSQTNFDSQWIAFEAKDAFNAGGIGALFNAMNFGQALMLHIVLVPIILVLIVGIHVLMVRIRGVVPPIGAEPAHLGENGSDATIAPRTETAEGQEVSTVEVGQ